MEKLNLDSDSPPKAEIRRDVVDAPAPLVSEQERELQRRGSREGEMGIFTLSCYCFVTSYLQPLAWEQRSSYRPLHCVLKSKTEQSRGLAEKGEGE